MLKTSDPTTFSGHPLFFTSRLINAEETVVFFGFVLVSSWRDDLFIRRPCLPCEYQNPLLPDKMPMRASTDDARTESIPIPFSVHAHCLRTGLLLLLLPQGEQTDTRNLDDLESHTGDITLGLALTTETSQEHLVVLVHEVQATVVGNCKSITCQLITSVRIIASARIS